MKISRSMLALAFVALTGIAGAQSVSSGFTTNNGQSGVMFDVNSTIPVLISNFDINIDAGSWTVNIYHFNGSFLGNQATATGWTLDASVPVTGVGLNLVTPLSLSLSIPVNPGTPTGIYMTVTSGTSFNYTTGATGTFQNTLATDGIVSITSGIGKALPLFTGGSFGGLTPAVSGSRQFSGTVYYLPTNPPNNGTGQAPQAGVATLNVNDARDVDNYPLAAGGNGPYAVNVTAGTNMVFKFGGAANQPIVFLSGPLNVNSFAVAGVGQLDIGTPNGFIPNDIFVISDGAGLTGLFPEFFTLDSTGKREITFNASGLQPGLALSFQCAMFTGGPSIIAFSNAVTVNTL